MSPLHAVCDDHPVCDARLSPSDRLVLSSPEELIEDARNGRMFILVDDEDRENEGDLIIPAQMVTPDSINFMATHGRGLICLAMDEAMVARLGLPMMAARNTSGHGTAFTVSIEAKDGVSTGISAPDRARTIQVAIDPTSGPNDIAMPGHVFPLRAQKGGVLVRAGHTEAAVDIARLAGLRGAGVICEVMNEDGTMSRMDDLIAFSQKHSLKLGTIADLIAYRLRTEQCVEHLKQEQIESRYGGAFTLHTYRNLMTGEENMALVKGTPDYTKPVLVRVHAMNVKTDLLGIGQDTLHCAMDAVGAAGAGVVLLLQSTRAMEEDSTQGLANSANDKAAKAAVKTEKTLRSYGIGAQILIHLGVRDMVLLTSSPKHVIGLQGFGLNIVEQRGL